MKHRKIVFSALIAGGLLAVMPSCNKIEDFGDTNQNPNATTSPSTAALLTNTLANFGSHVWNNTLTLNGGLYAQFMSETQYTEASRYATPNINKGGYYSGQLNDLQNIINYNTDPSTAGAAAVNGSNANQIATARILKAYVYWILTDSYGDIPYFQALKGDGLIAYDKQSDIYADLIKELKEAVDQFDGGTVFKGDILYNGNTTKWKKFANSLRVLIALRLSEIAASTAQTELASALGHSAGVIEDNADNATLVYPGGVYNHPLYQYYNITQRFDYALSKTITDFQATNNDARRAAFGSSTVGFPYGLTRDDAVAFSNANTNWSYVLAASKRTPTSSIVIVGAADIWLARAEAIQRNWISGTVATAYSTGIQRSWEQWGVFDQTTFDSYLTQAAVAIGVNPLQKIQVQQWLAFFPNGTQGWSNWRRTNQPSLTPAPGAGLPIPVRIPYGPDEFNLNKANADAAAAQYTVGGVPNSQNSKVWWDAN